MTSAPHAPSRLRSSLYRLAAPIVVLMAVLGVWFFISLVILDPDRQFLLPAPNAVVEVGFLNQNNLLDVLEGLLWTVAVSMSGLVIAIVLGMTSAIMMSQAKWIETSFYPYAVVIQTVPILAIVPLVGLWLGFGFTSRVVVCVIISIFPIITNTLFGLQSVPPSFHDLFTLHKASRWTRLVKLQFPNALPAIFTGFRISAGLSVIGAIVGEFFFRKGIPGLGRLLDLYRARLLTEQLFTALVFSSLLGILVFWGFGLLGRLAVGKWHETT